MVRLVLRVTQVQVVPQVTRELQDQVEPQVQVVPQVVVVHLLVVHMKELQ